MLLIRFSALGDVAMTVPVVRAAAEQNPDISFDVLSQVRFEGLFENMPANVRFIGVDLKRQSLKEITQNLGTYEMVADLHGVWRSMYIRHLLRLRGARVRSIRKGRFSKWLLTHGWIHRPLKPTATRYAEVLTRLGIPVTLPPMQVKETGQGIGVAPFAAHIGKIYPLDRMEQVVRLLSQKGERVILFGRGEQEEAVLSAWATKYPHVESVAGLYNLEEELQLMKGLRVMISMDSANMHLASLVGTRVVSIWGATHPNTGFMGYGQAKCDCVQRDLNCRPCSVYGNKKCKYGDYRCLAMTPEEIVAHC